MRLKMIMRHHSIIRLFFFFTLVMDELIAAEPIATKLPEPMATKLPEPMATKLPEPIATRLPEPIPAKLPEPVSAKLTVPEGFVVEQVAAPPLVGHPMMATFDDRGRLFVSESAGLNLDAEGLLAALPNQIRLLEDTDGDGRFDKSTVFADKMTFPMGVLWHDGALYTASPPSIWRLEDTDGDGVADDRREVVTKFGFSGNAADIHGPFLGPDGWLYWTDGRHGHEITLPDGQVLKGHAARIFRCLPDGQRVEVVCGGGMDDPVEICFTPEGEPLATVDILYELPARIDAVIHCIHGGVFPYWEEDLEEFKRTGEVLTAVTKLGWVAPAGLMRYRDEVLGAEYQDKLFTAQFNTHKIQRHELIRDGATFKATNEDFLVSSDPDFHPTDVLEDADGSLLVVNTGGWFLSGCPTSQVTKPQIQGGIYRVRRVGSPTDDDPRGLKLAWQTLSPKALVKRLDDRRHVVRDRAIGQLAALGKRALPALSEAIDRGASVRLRRNAVWAATRIEAAEARAVVRRALTDQEAGVRVAAAHSVGLHRDAAAQARLIELLLADESAAVRREAATDLGRLRSAAAVPDLLQGLAVGGDRFLEHSLIYALIEIAARDETLAGLEDESPLVRRGALIALDQMDGGDLPREAVMPLLGDHDAALRQTAWAVVIAQPSWARDGIALMRKWLRQTNLPPARREMLRSGLAAFGLEPAIERLMAAALADPKTHVDTRLLLLQTMADMPIGALPADWSAPLIGALGDSDERVIRRAIAAIRGHRDPQWNEALLSVANDESRAIGLRVTALTALSPGATKLSIPLFDLLRTRLSGDIPALDRVAAAEALANSRLDDGQLAMLTGDIARCGPLEISYLVAVYEGRSNPLVGAKLVAALAQSKGLENLSAATLRRTLEKYPSDVRHSAEPLLNHLDIHTEPREAKLAALAAALKSGNADRGRALFFSGKAACSTCHAIGADGGHIGPELSKIGGIRSRRDLLEAIVFPSASIVRGYEPYLVATDEGKVYSGLISRRAADAVHLLSVDRTETRISRSSIESIERGRVSIMPRGLDAQLSQQDLADLLTLLESLR